jgi:hypothetical protein
VLAARRRLAAATIATFFSRKPARKRATHRYLASATVIDRNQLNAKSVQVKQQCVAGNEAAIFCHRPRRGNSRTPSPSVMRRYCDGPPDQPACALFYRIRISNSPRHTFAISLRITPELMREARPSRIERARGMPGDGLTHGPPATKKQAAVTTGSAGSTGIPRAMVLTVSFVLFSGTGLSCPRHSWFVSTNLAPASGRQNHTTSPSAHTPLVAQMNCARRCASIASRPTFRDDRP